jgi:hypothetical protein
MKQLRFSSYRRNKLLMKPTVGGTTVVFDKGGGEARTLAV